MASLSTGKINKDDLECLVKRMSKTAFRVKNSSELDETILQHCLNLCAKDYKYSVLDNANGELCNHYPRKLILLEYQCKDGAGGEQHESMYDMASMATLFTKARFARCRTRFVVPVILFEGKHICRSSTISSGAEMYGRSGLNMVLNNGVSIPNEMESEESSANGDWQLHDRIRGQDIRLLKRFNISNICDLMLENKKVKYFVNVTSSEKVDKENRYSEFSLWSLPYPGCEFFKVWRDNGYSADKDVFDWSQDYVNTSLEFPPYAHLTRLGIHWHEYKKWNLVELTQNYLKVLLQHIQEGDSGILIHCISGWDRTPLFISLLRLSLWADGLIHTSLSALEMVYLTVAYDWYQFGHNLPDRLIKGEEILFFCFAFLKHIQDDEYIVRAKHSDRSRNVSRAESEVSSGGILLETIESEFPSFGSCSSLGSSVSATSYAGVMDGPPQLFMVGCPDEDGAMTSASANGRTTPVQVPDCVRKRVTSSPAPDHRSSSPTVGSWQVITGTGSYVGSATASPYSHKSTSSSGGDPPLVHQHSSLEPSDRRVKLEEVRVAFYTAYSSVIGLKNGPDESSGISSVINMLSDTVVAFSTKLT